MISKQELLLKQFSFRSVVRSVGDVLRFLSLTHQSVVCLFVCLLLALPCHDNNNNNNNSTRRSMITSTMPRKTV